MMAQARAGSARRRLAVWCLLSSIPNMVAAQDAGAPKGDVEDAAEPIPAPPTPEPDKPPPNTRPAHVAVSAAVESSAVDPGAIELADMLLAQIPEQEANGSFTRSEAKARELQVRSLQQLAQSLIDHRRMLEQRSAVVVAADRPALDREQEAVKHQLELACNSLRAEKDQFDRLRPAAGWALVDKLLSARCSTAICFQNGGQPNWLGIEPLVELPVGISFAVNDSALSD